MESSATFREKTPVARNRGSRTSRHNSPWEQGVGSWPSVLFGVFDAKDEPELPLEMIADVEDRQKTIMY
jgi:hypothetical protein